MTGIEMSSILLCIVYTFVVFSIGVLIGGLAVSAYISRKMHEINDQMARKLLAPPPPDGDEWKQKVEDEKWMREQIDGKQKDNDTEKK